MGKPEADCPLTGKMYSDYLKDEEARYGKIRAARLKAAKDARCERIKAGIDISISKGKIVWSSDGGVI